MRLGINIDHIATLRQARKEGRPNLINAAKVALQAGATFITVHLREDRRHIEDQDVLDLNAENIPINLEMAATHEMVTLAKKISPMAVCFVPEKRSELTTEGGLNILKVQLILTDYITQIKSAGTNVVSVFIEASTAQVDAAKAVGATAIEIHTGAYANARGFAKSNEYEKIKLAAKQAKSLGLAVHAGHGLDTDNIKEILAISEIEEVNIGFSVIARSIFVGLEAAIKELNIKKKV